MKIDIIRKPAPIDHIDIKLYETDCSTFATILSFAEAYLRKQCTEGLCSYGNGSRGYPEEQQMLNTLRDKIRWRNQ